MAKENSINMVPIHPPDRVAAFRQTSGYSLLEALIGVIILALVLQGAYMMSRNSIQSNTIGRDLSKGSSVLKDFVDEMRGLNLDSIPRNLEVIDSSGQYAITWKVYDETSSGIYLQPVGLLLVCAKLTYTAQGRTHTLETATLLGKK
jgi:type II secretory pathway component PulJ